MNRDTFGLDVNDFETQNEFNAAVDVKRQKQCEARAQERKQNQIERQREAVDITNDKNIYTICGVSFPRAYHPYYYRAGDMSLKVGDTVIVSVGDKEAEGTIISIGLLYAASRAVSRRQDENDNI